MLLEMGKRSGSPISVNFTVFSGATPLQLAALANGAARISVLLKYGADPNMLSADMGHETALHIAARYCYPECVGMLLEAGANPLLPDAAGQSPLDLAGKGLLSGKNNADTLKQTRALLKKYTSKFEGHLRSRSVKGTSSSSTTGTPGQTASGSGAAVHKDSCDLCGQVPEGRKIQKCGQCGLRGYCSRECQVKDWPIHKIPCQQVNHFKERLSVLLTPGQPGNERLQLAHMLPQKPAMQKLALDLKAIPKVLAAMPNDKAVRGGWLPTLTCVLGWLRDLDACGSAPSPQSALNPLAVQQFVTAGGPVLLLQQLSRADVCDDMRVDAMRGLSGVIRLKQGNKPLVTKGVAQDVVKLLAPWAANKSEKLMTNAAFCLAHLLRAEQHHLRQQSTAQPDQATDEQQKDSSELPPVAAAVLKHVDLKRLALAAGPSRPGGPYPGQYYQACLEFFCTLLDSKQTFKAIKTQHKTLLELLLENATSGVGIAAVDGWATNTEILIQCYRYGGIELIAGELGPIILQYPVDWDEHDPLTASAARGSGFVSADQVSAGQPLMCRMLFVSCLLDAAEHKEEMHKLSTCSIKCWRNGAVLLRACWDAIPELRTCYPEFLDRVFDLMNTRPAQKELFQDTLNRCCCQMQGQLLGQPYPSQDEYLAAVRRDPSACDILCKCLGLEVQGSGKSSREVLTSIMTSMSKFRAHMGLYGTGATGNSGSDGKAAGKKKKSKGKK